MKKNYIKLLFVSFFLFLVFPLGVNASNGYTIENYEVDIKVNENNVLNIKEIIDVNFEYEKHGIIRVIPYKNTYYRTGKTVETRALIKNLNVNANYTTSKENGELKVKIGDASTTLTGNKQYVITYDYDVGDDNVDDYDDFYFNVIGTNWDTEIKNVRFKIEMPKEFDTTKVNFTVGKYGSTYYEDVDKVGICYFIGTPFRKKGYMTEAINAYVQFFFKQYSESEIIATILDANTPSWKVAEKSGFNLIEKKMYKDIDDEKEELYRFYVIRGQEDK